MISTLYTNDSIGAVARLNDLGIDTFKIAGALLGSVAQRLLRSICPECKEPVQANPALLSAVNKYGHPTEDITFFKGRGCKKCLGTGYAGRIPIFEIVTVSRSFAEGIERGVPAAQLRDIAISENCRRQGCCRPWRARRRWKRCFIRPRGKERRA